MQEETRTRWDLRPATWGDERMMGPTLATGEAFVLRHLGHAFHFITTEPIANAMQERLNALEADNARYRKALEEIESSHDEECIYSQWGPEASWKDCNCNAGLAHDALEGT